MSANDTRVSASALTALKLESRGSLDQLDVHAHAKRSRL